MACLTAIGNYYSKITAEHASTWKMADWNGYVEIIITDCIEAQDMYSLTWGGTVEPIKYAYSFVVFCFVV